LIFALQQVIETETTTSFVCISVLSQSPTMLISGGTQFEEVFDTMRTN
jgi:hypothetical protein